MRLVDAGRLHLTDSLRTVLPQYPQWRAVTLRQLLNHTSGIHSYTADPAWARTGLRRDFFAPLGMRSATYCPSRPSSSEYATS